MEKNVHREIERKFLVKGAFKSEAFQAVPILQGYLSSVPERNVRVRLCGSKACLTIKGPATADGLSRFEWEKEINTEDARELAEKTVLLLGRDYERFGALHEYYMPDNGEPILNKGFQNWNLLVLNMAAWLDGKETVNEF